MIDSLQSAWKTTLLESDITPRLKGRGLPTLTSGRSCFAGERMDDLRRTRLTSPPQASSFPQALR